MNKRYLLTNDILPAGLGTCLAQSTVQFSTTITITTAEKAGIVIRRLQRRGETNTGARADCGNAKGPAPPGVDHPLTIGTIDRPQMPTLSASFLSRAIEWLHLHPKPQAHAYLDCHCGR